MGATTDTRAKARLKGDRYRVKGWTWEFFRVSLRVMPREEFCYWGFDRGVVIAGDEVLIQFMSGKPMRVAWAGSWSAQSSAALCAARKKQTRCATLLRTGQRTICSVRIHITAHPSAVDEIHSRANTIDLDYGGLYGNDLDDWLRAERNLTEAHQLRAGAKDKNP